MFICLPIAFGFPTRIKTDRHGDQTPRICPMCHNPAVQPAKARTWFELCFVPLVPLKSQKIWICPICNWRMGIQEGWQPQVVGNHQSGYPQDYMGSPSGAYQHHFQPGYQPSYSRGPMNPDRKAQ
ncbi:hypothetical protein BDW22DRAFT_1377169 [Trametopsis cervina]|nr:hypothetical protein BDW22DRAFT_1377169 [Trametopsis cervina]